MPSLGALIRAAGDDVITAPADQVGAVLLAHLKRFLPNQCRVETGVVVDSEGRTTEPLAALICFGGRLVGADVGKAVLPTESVAVAFDVTHTLDLNGLAAAYSRVAAAKALTKTEPAPGISTIEPTLGLIFAVDTTFALEDLAREVERLNARTPSDHWPDAVIIATKGQIGYMVQWVGEPLPSALLLPPSPDASRKVQFPCYAVLMISASGTGTFNLAMHMVLGHLARWSVGSVPPEYVTVLDDVPRQAITWTGYQYNLAGQLCPVPRECYSDRALPPKSVALYSPGAKEPLGMMCFMSWQDGGVILLQGKLPLEGILGFLGGIVGAETLGKVQKVTQNDLQISTVLPIKERQYEMLLRNIQQRGGLEVRSTQQQIVVQKFADEGSSSPFMARIFYGQVKMADALGAQREPFLKAHQVLMTTLMEIRDTAKEVVTTWKDHARKIDEGFIVERLGSNIRITENIDRPLGRLVNEFLTGATRSFKERMQQTARTLGVEIGFLYQPQAKFEKGVAALENTDRALAEYLLEARKWGNALVTTRNNLDHGDWTLQSAAVTDVSGRVVVIEPSIEGTPVTKWVTEMTDRILCFVEDVIAHGIQKRLGPDLTLAEIPVANRVPEMPLRFRNTIAGGGLLAWKIRYRTSRFDET